MLEWYRANEDYSAVIADCARLLNIATESVGTSAFAYRGRSLDATIEPQRISVVDAFTRYAGVDLLVSMDDRAALAAQAGVACQDSDNWSDIFSRILVERVEPHLGFEAPTILDQYPRVEAALARTCPHDPRVAERFELYVLGVELANGFGELTDPLEQRKRFEHEMNEKQRIYGERYPIDEDLLAALAHMPQASGVALGFDRLIMLATGAPHIEQVMWTPPAGRAS